MTRAEQEASLRACELFQSLSPPDIRTLVGYSSSISLPAGRCLVRKQENSDSLYVVAHGSVRAFLSSETGKELNVFIFGRGMAIDTVNLIDNSGALFHITTLEESELIRMPYQSAACLVGTTHLQHALLKQHCGELRHIVDMLENIALHSLEVRVARLIHRLHFLSQRNAAVRLHRLDQSTIASLVNGTRPRVNAQLQKLRRMGAIDIRSGSVVVSSLELLTLAAQLR